VHEAVDGKRKDVLARINAGAARSRTLQCVAPFGRRVSAAFSSGVDGLLCSVDRLALDHDRAQQHAECLGVRHATAWISRRDVLLEESRAPAGR
jgi:hypothetical protein